MCRPVRVLDRMKKNTANNLYTILPTQRAVDTFHQQQLDQLKLEATRRRVYQRQEYFARDRPHAASKP